jgi:hypothetical protein
MRMVVTVLVLCWLALPMAVPLGAAPREKKPHSGIARHVAKSVKKAARGVRWVVW